MTKTCVKEDIFCGRLRFFKFIYCLYIVLRTVVIGLGESY